MKSYYSLESVRMVGKGWEIRRMLKEIASRQERSSAAPSMLGEYLKRRCPNR